MQNEFQSEQHIASLIGNQQKHPLEAIHGVNELNKSITVEEYQSEKQSEGESKNENEQQIARKDELQIQRSMNEEQVYTFNESVQTGKQHAELPQQNYIMVPSNHPPSISSHQNIIHDLELSTIKGSECSRVSYEENYQFLQDLDFAQEHISIDHLAIHVNGTPNQIVFYQHPNQHKPQKIVTLENKSGKTNWNQNIRLPKNSHPISIEVNVKQSNSALTGMLKQDESVLFEKKSIVYDENGDEAGFMMINSKDVKQVNIQTVNLVEDYQENTLQDDVIQDTHTLQEISILHQNCQELPLPKHQVQIHHETNKQQKQHEDSQVTFSERKKSHKYPSRESDKEIVQKDTIFDYPLSKIQRLSAYKSPFISEPRNLRNDNLNLSKQKYEKQKQELGLKETPLDEVYLKSKRKKLQLNSSLDDSPLKMEPSSLQSVPLKKNQTAMVSESYQIKKSKDYGMNTLNNKQETLEVQTNIALIQISPIIEIANRSRHIRSRTQHMPSSTKSKRVQTKYQNKEQASHRPYLNERDIPQTSHNNKSTHLQIHANSSTNRESKLYQNSFSSVESSRIVHQKSNQFENIQNQKKLPKSDMMTIDCQFDLLINNLSVNFHKKLLGRKYSKMVIPSISTEYETELLHGNSLLWNGKGYFFKKVQSKNDLIIYLYLEGNHGTKLIGKVYIHLVQLVITQKQGFYQTFLINLQEIVAVVILGFQIIKKPKSLPASSKSINQSKYFAELRSLTEMKKMHKLFENVGLITCQSSESKSKLISKKKKKNLYEDGEYNSNKIESKVNPIRAKRYIGGKNIRIGRANRFEDESTPQKKSPGPGDYEAESTFSRYELKQE